MHGKAHASAPQNGWSGAHWMNSHCDQLPAYSWSHLCRIGVTECPHRNSDEMFFDIVFAQLSWPPKSTEDLARLSCAAITICGQTMSPFELVRVSVPFKDSFEFTVCSITRAAKRYHPCSQ